MSINNWGWKHYHGQERSMAYYLAHPNEPDPADEEAMDELMDELMDEEE